MLNKCFYNAIRILLLLNAFSHGAYALNVAQNPASGPLAQTRNVQDGSRVSTFIIYLYIQSWPGKYFSKAVPAIPAGHRLATNTIPTALSSVPQLVA